MPTSIPPIETSASIWQAVLQVAVHKLPLDATLQEIEDSVLLEQTIGIFC